MGVLPFLFGNPFICGKLVIGSPPLQEVRYHPSPQQLSAAVAGGFSFLFGNPFIYGTLLAGKVTSLWRGAILPHRPYWLLVAFGQWGHFFCRLT